jgi:hypothetical protein
MNQYQRALLFALAILGAFAIVGTPACGSSVGFHEFLKHAHPEALVLPPLYQPAPDHVPTLSNAALLRFWETDQFSPIWRNSQVEMQLCEAVTEHRNLNPTRFDHNHPLLGHLLRDPNFFAYALQLYNSHPARFVHYHHHLIPVIRGCAMMMEMKPIPVATSPETIHVPPVPAGETNVPPPAVSTTVPAPPSIVLIALGAVCVALRARLRRRDVTSST